MWPAAHLHGWVMVQGVLLLLLPQVLFTRRCAGHLCHHIVIGDDLLTSVIDGLDCVDEGLTFGLSHEGTLEKRKGGGLFSYCILYGMIV